MKKMLHPLIAAHKPMKELTKIVAPISSAFCIMPYTHHMKYFGLILLGPTHSGLIRDRIAVLKYPEIYGPYMNTILNSTDYGIFSRKAKVSKLCINITELTLLNGSTMPAETIYDETDKDISYNIAYIPKDNQNVGYIAKQLGYTTSLVPTTTEKPILPLLQSVESILDRCSSLKYALTNDELDQLIDNKLLTLTIGSFQLMITKEVLSSINRRYEKNGWGVRYDIVNNENDIGTIIFEEYKEDISIYSIAHFLQF